MKEAAIVAGITALMSGLVNVGVERTQDLLASGTQRVEALHARQQAVSALATAKAEGHPDLAAVRAEIVAGDLQLNEQDYRSAKRDFWEAYIKAQPRDVLLRVPGLTAP